MTIEAKDSDFVKTLGWRILPWMADILCAFLVWWAVQINAEIKDIKNDINEFRTWQASSRATAYTVQDHARFSEHQAGEVTRLWSKIAEIQQQWLRDVGEIKASIARIETKLER